MYPIEMHEASTEFARCWDAAGNHIQSRLQDPLRSWLKAKGGMIQINAAARLPPKMAHGKTGSQQQCGQDQPFRPQHCPDGLDRVLRLVNAAPAC